MNINRRKFISTASGILIPITAASSAFGSFNILPHRRKSFRGGGSNPGNVGITDDTSYVNHNADPADTIITLSTNSGAIYGTVGSFWMMMYNVNASSRQVHVVIYDQTDSDTLIHNATESPSTVNTPAEWREFDLSSYSIPIVASNDYRIGVQWEYQWSGCRRSSTGGTVVEENQSSAWESPPTTWSGSSIGVNGMAVYLTVV